MIDFVIKKRLKRTNVRMYNDISQLPIERFTKINMYWMLHDDLGSSMEDIDKKHLQKLFVIAGDREKSIKELKNLRILIYNVLNEVNISHFSFAALVESINGELCNDLTDDGLERTLKKLAKAGLTEGTLKKKMKQSGIQFMKSLKESSLVDSEIQ